MFTKFRIFLIALTLIGASSSYVIGRDGINVGRTIVESRCSAGAFIAHSRKSSPAQPDSHSDASPNLPTVSGQVAANYAPITLTSGNLIKNGTLEIRNGINPTGWSSNAVGKNTSNFSNVAGYQSAHGLRIDVSQYSDGTADWFGPSIQVTPGNYYEFRDYYRSSTASRAVLQLKDNTGRSQYINLDSVPAASDWTLYNQRFFVPANVSEIIISHPLTQAGWLETDNYALASAAAPGFATGMVSVTFDDGWRSIHDNALPVMKKYDIVSTQYLVSGFLGSLKEYMTARQTYDFVKAGHEIGSHSFDHADLTKVTGKDLDKQLATSKKGLDKCFQNVTAFAAPFGATNANTISAIKPLYATARSTESGFNSPDTLNPYRLKVQNVRRDTPPAQVQAWIDTAAQNHIWLILVYHQVSDSPGEYSRQLVDFETDMLILKNSNLEIMTMHNAYVKSQTNAIEQ